MVITPYRKSEKKQMKYSLISTCVTLFLILTINLSCTKGDGNISGEWNLKSMSSICTQGNLIEEFETFESNGLCCITTFTTVVNDTLELTFTTTTCQKLIFNNDGQVDIINESNSIRDTSSYIYDIIDNTIEVCPIVNECVNYTLINNEIEITLPIATQSGLTCDRKFIYRR